MPLLAAGSLLGGRYRLERPLAVGGMGEVWRAWHVKLDIPVAVKRMSPALAASAAARARFEREAKAAARLSSPHVVEVHDYGVDADTPYIVMELLDGEDLAARLEAAGRLTLAEAAAIVEQIAKALAVAHESGVIHRDLKPGNVFLARKGPDEIVKVLDFGIAKLHAGSGAPGTLPGTVIGSPSYMSPEQARAEAEIDHRSDLWSLGVLAFQCVTGWLPFAGADVAAMMAAITSGEVPRASSFLPVIPAEVDAFFARALTRPRAGRFQSALELAAAFHAACGTASRPAGPLSMPPGTHVTPPGSRATPSSLRDSGRLRVMAAELRAEGGAPGEGLRVTPVFQGQGSDSTKRTPTGEETVATGGRRARALSPPRIADGVPEAAGPAPLAEPGDVIVGRFEIERAAGEGGMGVVYRAKDSVTGQTVALKLLRAATFDTERFFREARVLSELRHPGVVRYVAHGVTAEGQPYLAMEWVEGGDLDARLREAKPSAEECLGLAHRVAEALGAAHRRGVVHGDLKPHNVLLAGGDLREAKVIDFGIARLVKRAAPGAPEAAQRRDALVFGTPGYMAPEQVRGDPIVDARADVFALGCVLFEGLTGRSPFAAESAIVAMARTVNETAPRASAFAAGVAEDVEALLARLLAKAPADRPSDGAAAAELIQDVLRASRIAGESARVTAGERKLLPAILIVPPGGTIPSSSSGLRFADEVRSEDSTWEASGNALELGARLGPIARRFQAQAGVVQGAAVSVVLDGAGSLSDLATRAALCALSLRAAEPAARIAIATGRRGVRGDVLDRAAATMSAIAAPPRATSGQDATGVMLPGSAATLSATLPGGPLAGSPTVEHVVEARPITLDDTTFGLLDGRFDVERSPAGYLLHGKLRGAGDVRPLLGKTTPCAGREPELGMLDALFRECADEPAAKAVILKGAAGAGKSRVRTELLRRIQERDDSAQVWLGRGDVMNAGSPFAILAQAFLAMLDLAGGEPEGVRRERLAARVAERVPADRQARVTAFLGSMIGLPLDERGGPEALAAREDALLYGDQLRRAFEDFVSAECDAGPVILVLEDLHLGDQPTVKLVDAALRTLADRPLFVLATARPEVDDLFPAIWEERVPQVIRVGPLSPKASEKIVRHVLGSKAAPDLVAKIVARAAGHPLHLEEMIRAVAERGDGELPDTVLATVEARIGALDPAARRVLRAASVFGRTFWEGAIVALTRMAPREAHAWLGELTEREWLTRMSLSRFQGEAELMIAQDLVQEAAYAMLPDEDRAVGHRIAGEWLREKGERDALALARHFSLGNDPSRAAEFLLLAADQALDANDFAGAIEHAGRALGLDPPFALAGRASALSAEAHFHRGDMEDALRRGADAMERVPPSEAMYFRACSSYVCAAGRLGDMASIAAIARRLVEMEPPASLASPFAAAASHTVVQLVVGAEGAEADPLFQKLQAYVSAIAPSEPLARAYLHRAAGARAAFSGDLFGSIVSLRETIRWFDAAGDLRQSCANRKTLGWYLGECGALEEAERALREAIATARRMGLTNLAPHALHDLGSPLYRLGKLDEAKASQEEALVAFEAQGDLRLRSSARALLAAVAVAAGRLDDAEREAQTALSIAPTSSTRFTALAHLAAVRNAAGRHEEALAIADEAVAILDEKGGVEECVVLCLLERARALFALGREDEGALALARAHREIETRAAQIADPELSASFVARIPENARVVRMVREREDRGA